MTRFLCKTFLTLALLAICAWALPAHAAEGEAPSATGNESAKDATKDKDKSKEAEGEAPKKKGSDDVSGGRFAGDPVYVHIAPMVLPVISTQGVEQLVTLILDVEVKDFDTADNMHTNMPRVQDALMRALYGGLGQGNLRNGKLVDVAKVKAKATAALNEVLGEGGVREVLVQGVAQRML